MFFCMINLIGVKVCDGILFNSGYLFGNFDGEVFSIKLVNKVYIWVVVS